MISNAATESAYRLSVRCADAGLDAAARAKRTRLEAWVAEQLRVQDAEANKSKDKRTAEDFRRDVEKQAASTLLNRLILLRLMEAPGPNENALRVLPVVTGGWESRAYKDFRQLAPALVRGDDSEGYAFLLRLVFDDLATDLPGLYGPAGIAELVPIPTATLRHVVDELDKAELALCWTDDMTLGWVYQYWNDPERERLDDKLTPKKKWGSGKIERHEIASKTQMFTERYMVDWLLQNSLGPMWLAMCKKHGWTPDVESGGVLDALEQRRVEWRTKREAGEVELGELMPLHSELERRWAYYVPQPIPDDAVAKAPATLRDLKLLDPAVGSGHFLVVALDLLFALYQEEARHWGEARSEAWSDRAIVERILSHNLHGIDLDPRAVQIAAAALWLKAQQLAPGAHPERLNLVASNLKLASLPDDDLALVELRRAVEKETGIPAKLTDTLVHALRGADHLGSLLKVDAAVESAIAAHEKVSVARLAPSQQNLFGERKAEQAEIAFDAGQARKSLVDLLEEFLGRHTAGDDLGLRLRGEQLASGVRFVRLINPGTYDVVVANPPYQGTAKMADAKYVEKVYPQGKADLYAAFLLRGLELVREGGVSGMLTMRNWMFIKQYAGLREHLLTHHGLTSLHDLSSGAFEEISAAQVVVSVASSIFTRGEERRLTSVLKAFDEQTTTQVGETLRKRAATLCQVGRHEFEPAALKVVPEWPLVYWWDEGVLSTFEKYPLLGKLAPLKLGVQTSNSARFDRLPWEPLSCRILLRTDPSRPALPGEYSVPYVKGAEGHVWVEPMRCLLRWANSGLELKVQKEVQYGNYARHIQSESRFFRPGVACSPIGNSFTARAHRYPSIIDNMGLSVFTPEVARFVVLLNSSRAREVLSGLNPTVHFTSGDINRLPVLEPLEAAPLFETLSHEFASHECHREPSLEFKSPGPSPWRHVQNWAQLAVDRPEGAPLPKYKEELDPEPVTDHLSFALGVALGRFGAGGEGILDPEKADLSRTLPAGILFLDTTLDEQDHRDGLGHTAAVPLHDAWKTHGPAIDTKRSLREWLALDFFKDVHKGMYETRPIHWPLSSAKKTFVAWVNIHRMNEQTLRVLLADHLMPTLARIEGELNDLREARDGADKNAARDAEKRYDKVLKSRDELKDFVTSVEQCADHGAPPIDNEPEARELDARYAPDLDDGVMINSAALWPLLDPQWKDPKKWWKQLSNGDYDWAHLAMRYWPDRVDAKCKDDPSLGVAHGCFWRYHAGRAWAWELRLQDEIGPDFRTEEKPYRPGGKDLGDTGDAPHRSAYLRDHAEEALAAIEKEALRRMGRSKKRKLVSEVSLLESGLWTEHFEELWTLELRLSEKQGAELRITAPDESAGRSAYLSAHPKAQKDREKFMKDLKPPAELFDEELEDEADLDEAADDEAEAGE